MDSITNVISSRFRETKVSRLLYITVESVANFWVVDCKQPTVSSS